MPRHKTHKQKQNTTQLYSLNGNPFVFAKYSIPCERHPDRNEDNVLVAEYSGLAAVFDGVGGSAAGHVASQTASRAARERWDDIITRLQLGRKKPTLLDSNTSPDLCAVLEHLILEADQQVRTDGARQAGTNDLATTVAMAAVIRQPDTRDYKLVYAHVGDSRIYLLHDNEPLRRLTSDDGLLAKLIENQMLDDDGALRIDQAMSVDDLSETEYNYFRLRGGITQALGGPPTPTIHTGEITVAAGDRILLCTDGIHDNLTDKEIEAIIRSTPRQSAARALVEHSLIRSRQERYLTVRAKPDDMSAVVITCRFQSL